MSSLQNISTNRPKPDGDGNNLHQRPTMTTTSEEYGHEVYRSEVDEESIQLFLRQNDLFDTSNSRWFIPNPSTPGGLFSSIYAIVRDVVDRFVSSTQAGVTRAVAGFRLNSEDQEFDRTGRISRPILVIRASGPSFEDPFPSNTVHEICSNSVSDVASYIAVKPDCEMGGVKETVKEMEGHAKRIFEEQPNRMYVRSLVVTETRARLVHFDRAGVEVTPLIDIHQHPATLVRLIAGLASTDEQLLGLDTSIQWTIVNGRKDRGTLKTTGPGGNAVTYPILEHIPIPRESIAGRGTNCWRVQDPDTLEELVVKDSWRPDYLPPEYDLLELVNGLPGVVQMVSYEVGRGETRDFRCPSTTGKCHNRVAMRTTMKSYGKSINYFTSVLQVLYAIRDAIAGHERLLKNGLGILHRDISHNNILIGAEGASEGHRGILIDLDMAFRATDEHPTVPADFNVGTRPFQSLTVLDTYEDHHSRIMHDYLDDLESFFYVLAYIFLVHRPDGSRVSSKEEGPSIVGPWDHPNPSIAGQNKTNILGGGSCATATKVVDRNWGSVCASLFTNFCYWISDAREDKIDLFFRPVTKEVKYDEGEDDEDGENGEDAGKDTKQGTGPLDSLYALREGHYAHVLGLFDEAIKAILATTPNPTTSHATNVTEVSSTQPSTPTATVPDQGAPPPDDAVECPTVVANTPVRSTPRPPSPPPALTQPHRSSHIQALRLKAGERPLSSKPTPPQLPKPTPHTPPVPPPVVRRSARVLKRRLAETDPVETPPSKSRRLKKGVCTSRIR